MECLLYVRQLPSVGAEVETTYIATFTAPGSYSNLDVIVQRKKEAGGERANECGWCDVACRWCDVRNAEVVAVCYVMWSMWWLLMKRSFLVGRSQLPSGQSTPSGQSGERRRIPLRSERRTAVFSVAPPTQSVLRAADVRSLRQRTSALSERTSVPSERTFRSFGTDFRSLGTDFRSLGTDFRSLGTD